jgi:hypothetical protein
MSCDLQAHTRAWLFPWGTGAQHERRPSCAGPKENVWLQLAQMLGYVSLLDTRDTI